MKRYGNLFSLITDKDNLILALHNASSGKLKYDEVKEVLLDVDYHVAAIQSALVNKTYKSSDYVLFDKMDKGKLRRIAKLPFFPDRIIQHAILQITEPIWKKSLISGTYQSIKGRGVHSCLAKVVQAVQLDKVQYFLQVDVKQFYPSINITILKAVLRRKIKCKDTLWLLDTIIDGCDGLPIGNYISQYFGNLFLSSLDHYVKETLRIKHYYRYCDDLFILGNEKQTLWCVLQEINNHFSTIDLTVKENYQVSKISPTAGVSCLGYCVYPKHIEIRRTIVNNFAKKIKLMVTKKRVNLKVLGSYYGWFKHSNSYGLWVKMVQPIMALASNSEKAKLHKLTSKLRINNDYRRK